MLNYSLPKERIAQFPVEPRDSARLLVLDRNSVRRTEWVIGTSYQNRIFHDLPELLRPGDCLVLNDTKVIPARIYGRKAGTGGKVELLLLDRYDVPRAGSVRRTGSEKCVVYRCLGQPAKNLKPGTRLQFDHGSLQAEVLAWENGERLVRFEGRGVEGTLLRIGEMPLPPYIDRPVERRDAEWYQTVFARELGAVAAPTAGLHFTPELLRRIEEKGIRIAHVTLHVGWGTFKPVGEKELAEGKLRLERFHIPEQTIGAITQTKKAGKRVIAVGTTVVRALETGCGQLAGHRSVRPSEADLARHPASLVPARKPFRDTVPARPPDVPSHLPAPGLSGVTDLFIRPGFKFRVVDALVTNFHLPGTSLLLLVSAFAGEERIQAAYQEAIQKGYRFYSYGDAMVIL